jgi:hypothetical protein
MRSHLVGALAASLFVIPAFAASPPITSPSPGNSAPGQPVAKSIWHEDKVAVTTPQSGLSCATTVGSFNRVAYVAYDGFGLDISCNYVDASQDILTIYLTQRLDGHPISADLQEAERELTTVHPDATPLADDNDPAWKSDLTWLHALYRRATGEVDSVWIADIHGWTLEFRGTYTTTTAQTMRDEMSLLTSAAEQSAGQHIAACIAVPSPERSGSPLADKQSSSLALMWSITAAAEDSSSQEKTVAPEWCVEEIVKDPKTPMILWHNVKGDLSEDRVTMMTIEESAPILSGTESMLGEIAKEQSNNSSIYAVTLTHGQTSSLLALFNGRPPADALIGIARDVFNGRGHTLTSYDRAGKTIQIQMPDAN